MDSEIKPLVVWEISTHDGMRFSFKRRTSGEDWDEAYLAPSREIATIYAASIIQGYQPPQGLRRSDKPFD